MAILSPTSMQTIELGATGWRIIVNNDITYLNGFVQSITASGGNPSLYVNNLTATGSITATGTVSAANATTATQMVALGQLQNGSLSLNVAFLQEPGASATNTTLTTLTPNCATQKIVIVTALANALTIANPIGTPINGQKLIISLHDNGTAQALTWGNAYYYGNNILLPTTTTVATTTYLGFIYNQSLTRWDLIAGVGV